MAKKTHFFNPNKTFKTKKIIRKCRKLKSASGNERDDPHFPGQPNFSMNVSAKLLPLTIFVVATIKSYAIPSCKQENTIKH